ncbi:polysaccharide deacetylase family protein [soil metagenome]
MIQNPALQWRPSLLLQITFVLHAAMLVALVAAPHAWRWILAALLLNHLILTTTGMWPRSTWLGPNLNCLPPASAARREIALTIDDGPHPEVTPKVLDLLDRHGVKASFFCVGREAQKHPALCRMIVERGHEIENHTQHHFNHFAFLGPAGLTREIDSAQRTIASLTGRTPAFFRAPAGIRSPLLAPVLAKLGLQLAAWSRRGFDARNPDPAAVSRRLMQGLQAGAILLLHDGNSARTTSGEAVILAVLPGLLDAAKAADLHFVTLSQALAPPST